MEVEEILAQLERNEGYLPQLAMEEAVAHREEIIPRLLSVLEDVARDPQPYAADGDRMIHIHAMYLLAQFRETRAYPLLVRIFAAPGDLTEDLAGDVVTEDLSSILASVSGGDPSGIIALVENELANQWVRGAALDGLVMLAACGLRTREEVMTYFASLFQKLDRKPSEVWDGLAVACADLCPIEVEAELRQAYEDELIDPWSISWQEIHEAIHKGKDACLEQVRGRYHLITSAVEELKWWTCFDGNEGEPDEFDEVDVEPGDPDDETDDFSLFPGGNDDFVPAPYRRPEPKVGRNEPCPCGSGKKYKKCCGR